MSGGKYTVKQNIGYIEQGAVVKGVENNIQVLANSLTLNVDGDLIFRLDISEFLSPQGTLSTDKAALKEFILEGISSTQRIKEDKAYIKILGRLPRFYHDFLDRVKEYEGICRLLKESPKAVLLITGLAGMGKTWLVTKVIQTLVQDSSHSETSVRSFEKIYYLRCEDNNLTFEKLFLEISELADKKQEALKLIVRRDITRQDKINFLLQQLCSFKFLIVLDSFEKILTNSFSISQTLDDLDAFFGCLTLEEHCSKLMIISRYIPVRLGNSRINNWDHIPLTNGLPQEEAKDLLKQLNISSDTVDLQKIIEKTYGIPRALESVSALLYEGNIAVVDSFSQIFKDKVVEDLVNLQISSLDFEEKEILSYSAIFRIPFKKEALLWISEYETSQTDRLINSLYLKRLLEVNNQQDFTLHPLIREVLLGLTDIETFKKLNSKIAQYYSLANWNNKPLNLNQMSYQLEAHFHYFAAKEFEKAGIIVNKLSLSLQGLGYHNYLESLLNDTIKTCSGVIEAMARHRLAGLAFTRGQLEEAETQWLQALKIFESEKNPNGIAHIYHSLGRVKQTRGNYQEALNRYDSAIKISLENNNYIQAGISQHQVAYIHFLTGNYNQALHASQICLSYRELGKHIKGKAISLHLLGMIKEIQGDYKEAENDYRSSLEIEQSYGIKNRIAICIRSLGNICLVKGKLEEAKSLFNESYEIVKELGAKLSIAESLDCMGTVSLILGEIEIAESFFSQSFEIRQNVGFPLGIAQSLRHFSNISLEKGEYQLTRSYLEEGLEIVKKQNNKLAQIDIWLDFGKLELRCFNFLHAKELANQALCTSQEIGYRAGVALAQLLLGEVFIQLKVYPEASQQLINCKKIFSELERTPDIIKAQQLLRELEEHIP